jgi:hypothetical protein
MKRMANKPAAPNAGIASRFEVGHHWPGVGEPGRSAMKKLKRLALLACSMMVSSVSASLLAQGSLLGDHVNIRWLLNGAYLDPVDNPGYDRFNVEVRAAGPPEYDFLDLGVVKIDIDSATISLSVGDGGIGWANHNQGFTGFEISDLDWQDSPGARLDGISVSIAHPDLVDQANGASFPYSASNVSFGDDWVRILTAGYNMQPGFDIRVDVLAVPEPSSIGLVFLGALTLFLKKRRI